MKRFFTNCRTFLFILAAAIIGCDRSYTSNETRNPTTAPASGSHVSIDNFTFSPAELTVAVGQKVTWTNHDDVPHTVTSSTKDKVLASSALDTDGVYSFQFKTPGTYDYYCAIHPHMTGKIIVK